MDNKKPAQTSRFLDPKASGTPAANAPRKPRSQAEAQRRPSGFGATGQPQRHKAAPKASAPAPEKKAAKPKKEKRTPKMRSEKKSRTGLKILLGFIAAVLIALVLLMIFGDKGTYHQMPIIEWEAEGAFAPDAPAIPGMEGL